MCCYLLKVTLVNNFIHASQSWVFAHTEYVCVCACMQREAEYSNPWELADFSGIETNKAYKNMPLWNKKKHSAEIIQFVY